MKMSKARHRSRPKPLTAKDRLKLAIAEQLGLLERIRREGWGNLSAQECGQVGGLLARTLKREKKSLAGKK